MSATDELLRLLDEFERDLCHAGCGAKCGTHEERRALIDGVKDRYAQAITATLGDDAKLCHATEANYRQCKYGTNRGWCDDAPFLVWDDTGHLFITMGGLKTWDVTDDAKAWFVTLGSMTATVDDALSLLDEMNEQGRIEYADYSQLHDAIAATLGGGKLTKEDVQRALFAHSTYANYDGLQLYANGIRTQEIADELNATLGGGECELAEVDSYSNANEVIHVLECSACGHTCEHVNGSYPRCPHCGTKAAKR